MKKCVIGLCAAMLPVLAFSQTISNGEGLHFILDQLYGEMMPLCKGLIGPARLIGGFGALWYIAARVWRNIAQAEPVDVYGLLRPFALGLCILLFPSVLDLINGILQPTVVATNAMVKGSNAAMGEFLKMKHDSILGSGVLNPANWIRELFRELLELLYQAAALIINAIRTFYLIVLAVIGPLVFALSIYDGFQHLLTVWLARYINVFLWLPVANIFGSIIAKLQELMVRPAVDDNFLFGSPVDLDSIPYLIFLLIGIVGYFTVPSVTNYIINAGGGNSLLHRVSSYASMAVSKSFGIAKQAISGGGAAGASSGMSADTFGDAASKMSNGMSENGVSNGYFKDKLSGKK
ncbi:MAG: conjugative transposon protein TraJ [Bacteroidota bacterium]